MKRVTMPVAAIILAACAFGCAGEATTPDSGEQEERETLEQATASGEEAVSAPEAIREQARPDPGCSSCGPLPDPWKVMGPLPDPWTPPEPNRSSKGGKGGKAPESGNGRP
jgi:hypothetical protein